jgi:hypothetical protein
VKGWKKIYQACRNQKQAGESILILDKADFMQISVRRDKEGHYKLIKGRNQQEDKIFLKIYSLNSSAPKFIKQILLSIKEQTGPHIIIVENLNTQVSSIDRTSR